MSKVCFSFFFNLSISSLRDLASCKPALLPPNVFAIKSFEALGGDKSLSRNPHKLVIIMENVVNYHIFAFLFITMSQPLNFSICFNQFYTDINVYGFADIKAELRLSFYAYVFCMQLRFQSNFLGLSKPW